MNSEQTSRQALAGITLAALGVVYGDIGTSPLYTFKECFNAEHLALTQGNILGIASMVFWAILLVVTLKYVTFMLRADDKGEGGIMVLMALARRHLTEKSHWRVFILGLLGASVSGDQRLLISWFGIRGIGSIYYLMFALNHGLTDALADQAITLTLTTVAVSIVVHGISVTPLMNLYAKRKLRKSHQVPSENRRHESR